ncbi:hypothetical protein [Cellulomonas massiliensis]|uniref:hypothetical protein n=1 Tax=Cellulomonas massiliensis TaxID=1465811 RepID=UPI0012B56472|nr:hypothetical protein [Cellulomonas massiliensis]
MVGLLVVGVVVGTLLVRSLQASSTTSPTPTLPAPPSPTASASSSTPAPTPSVTPPAAEFDDDSAAGLFVTPTDLRASVPAAAPGVKPGITAGQLAWGLPEGSSVDPAACTVAVTVVRDAPEFFDARSWFNDDLNFQQEVLLLDDADEARTAFGELVNTLDSCTTYSQANPGIDGATWTAQPALEGPGLYPSIVQEVTQTAEGDDFATYEGHLLVGNAIVSWTAVSLASVGHEAALATLGDPESLDALVQQRALTAVQSLAP